MVTDRQQCKGMPNHAVVITGYDLTTPGWPYWILKNSWGEKWGENGYFRLIYGQNMCGILSRPMVPMV